MVYRFSIQAIRIFRKFTVYLYLIYPEINYLNCHNDTIFSQLHKAANGVAFNPPVPILLLGSAEKQNAELKSHCLKLFKNFYLLAIVSYQHYQETNIKFALPKNVTKPHRLMRSGAKAG